MTVSFKKNVPIKNIQSSMTIQKEPSKFLKLILTKFAAGRKLTLGYIKRIYNIAS